MMRKLFYVLKEPVNGWSHIMGAFLSLIGSVVLIWRAVLQATAWHVVSFSIYGFSLVTLYTMSALYHSLKVSKTTGDILRQLDHAMIYFLIAGTYTPICLVVLRGGWGWTLLGINWTLAITGIVLKLVFRYPAKGVIAVFFAFFIIMGWLIGIAWFPLVRALPVPGVFLLVGGGLFYTLGAVLLNVKRLRILPLVGAHEIWHFFVLAGSFCHFWMMFKYVLSLA